MIEDVVTYEIALNLKELGFNEPCYAFWGAEPDGKPLLWSSTLRNVCNSDMRGRDVAAPFLWSVQKWLREAKGIALNVMAHDGGAYDCHVVFLPNFKESDFDNIVKCKPGFSSSYEVALASGIEAVLWHLQSENERTEP